MHNHLYRLLRTPINTFKITDNLEKYTLTPADFAVPFFNDQNDFHNLTYNYII